MQAIRWENVAAGSAVRSEKLQIVQLTIEPGASVAEIARAHGVNANQSINSRAGMGGGQCTTEDAHDRYRHHRAPAVRQLDESPHSSVNAYREALINPDESMSRVRMH